jgi:hypothetical protein
LKIIEHWRQAHSALPSWFLLCLPGESVYLSSAPALPRPSSYLIYPHPSTSRLRFIYRPAFIVVCLCLPRQSSQKNLKKPEKPVPSSTRSLKAPDRNSHLVRTHPPHLTSNSASFTLRAPILAVSQIAKVTRLTWRTQFSPHSHSPSIPQTNVRWPFFSLSLPHPEHRASHFAHFVSFSRQQSQHQALSRPRAIHYTRHHHDQPTDARTVSLDSHV